jgi:hypothetical protein
MEPQDPEPETLPRRSPPKREPLPEPEPEESPDLDPDAQGLTRSEVQSRLRELLSLHKEVLGAAHTTLKKAIRIGEILSEFKKALGHGKWVAWLAANVPFTDRTARNYMRVFDHRSELPETISDLTCAYRLLAEPKDATEGEESTEPSEGTEATATEETEGTHSATSATEEEESSKQTEHQAGRKTRPKAKKAKARKAHARDRQTQGEAAPNEWVEKFDRDIGRLVDQYAMDCQRDAAKMLAVAHVLQKYAARIEEDTAAASAPSH